MIRIQSILLALQIFKMPNFSVVCLLSGVLKFGFSESHVEMHARSKVSDGLPPVLEKWLQILAAGPSWLLRGAALYPKLRSFSAVSLSLCGYFIILYLYLRRKEGLLRFRLSCMRSQSASYGAG